MSHTRWHTHKLNSLPGLQHQLVYTSADHCRRPAEVSCWCCKCSNQMIPVLRIYFGITSNLSLWPECSLLIRAHEVSSLSTSSNLVFSDSKLPGKLRTKAPEASVLIQIKARFMYTTHQRQESPKVSILNYQLLNFWTKRWLDQQLTLLSVWFFFQMATSLCCLFPALSQIPSCLMQQSFTKCSDLFCNFLYFIYNITTAWVWKCLQLGQKINTLT